MIQLADKQAKTVLDILTAYQDTRLYQIDVGTLFTEQAFENALAALDPQPKQPTLKLYGAEIEIIQGYRTYTTHVYIVSTTKRRAYAKALRTVKYWFDSDEDYQHAKLTKSQRDNPMIVDWGDEEYLSAELTQFTDEPALHITSDNDKPLPALHLQQAFQQQQEHTNQ